MKRKKLETTQTILIFLKKIDNLIYKLGDKIL